MLSSSRAFPACHCVFGATKRAGLQKLPEHLHKLPRPMKLIVAK